MATIRSVMGPLPYTWREHLYRMKLGSTDGMYYTTDAEPEWRRLLQAAEEGYITFLNLPFVKGKRTTYARTAKTIELGSRPEYGFYFSPEHRTVVANWPAGETKTIEVFEHNLNKKMWDGGAGEGYYIILDEPDETHLTIRRTNKKMRPYKPRKAALPSLRDGVWPWKLAIHWERMQANPIRKNKEITKSLAGNHRSDLRLTTLYPTLINDQGSLRQVRADLEKVFKGPLPDDYYPSSWITGRFLGHGVTTRLLFLDLMVEPVFVDGKFTEFQPIDAAQVEKEYNILGGGTSDNPVIKYLVFMNQWRLKDG